MSRTDNHGSATRRLLRDEITPPRRGSLTAAALWRPWGWPARLVGVIVFLTEAFLAVGDQHGAATGWLHFLGLSTLAAAFVLLGLPIDDPYPERLAWTVAALAVLLVVLESSIAHSSAGLYADWHVGASVFVLMFLAFRTRFRVVWATFAVISGFEIATAVADGAPVLSIVAELLRHTASIAVALIVVVGIRRTAERLRALAFQRSTREASDAVRREISREQAAQLTRIDATAGELLRRLEESRELTPAEREECLLVEASLRDSMSGRGLATREVLAEARAARARGVRVVLLDNSKGQNPHREAAAAHVVSVIHAMQSGSCIVRLQPSNRERVLSITIEDDRGARLIELTAEQVGTL